MKEITTLDEAVMEAIRINKCDLYDPSDYEYTNYNDEDICSPDEDDDDICLYW